MLFCGRSASAAVPPYSAFLLQNVGELNLCFLHGSATGTPPSYSRRIPIFRSFLNRDRFIPSVLSSGGFHL